MFRADLPIYVMRIFSLNKARRSSESFNAARSRRSTRRVPARLYRIKLSCLASPSPTSTAPDPTPPPTPTRMERLADLKAAIAQGRYHVSAADLAQKLMDHLLGSRPPTD